MKILLFGKNGQVGWELNSLLQPLGEIIALGRDEADFSNSESLRGIVQATKPDVIVNAVAYTAVDRAEEDLLTVLDISLDKNRVGVERAIAVGASLFYADHHFAGEQPLNSQFPVLQTPEGERR